MAEAEAQLERARRRAAHPAGEYAYREHFTPRVDLANLDTPDVSHADQWAAFLNRPGRFYVAQIEIPLDDEALGQKLSTTTTLKADDDQLPYLVEVLRQVRGALGARCRITLTPAEPNVEDRRVAGPAARVTTTSPDGVTRIHRMARDRARNRDIDDLIERSSLGTPAAKAYRESVPPEVGEAIVRRADAARERTEPDEPCEHCVAAAQETPIATHERPATAEELAAVREMRARADARNGFTLPPANGKVEIPNGPPQMHGRDWVAEGQEFTRDEIASMLPGQTRAEVAQELGKAPEDLGGAVHHADVMPEQLAQELGVPVESLKRVAMTGGGYAWVVTPQPAPEVGRHAAPDEPA
ncbi:hypothetical protein BST13_33640 [Mycobacterium aquaticum]|uniref:Uncharacterized protein n=1 Tax=Mycobacterium aquaticum TaxID=1927124 RepID=A0A1X0A4X2_9MYCO|nr:hypothetical protein BST13_33640 [Mycobacterium aquaticum]